MRPTTRAVAIVGAVGAAVLPFGIASAAAPSWHAQVSHTVKVLKGINFTDSCHGWAVGEPPDNAPSGAKTPIVATSNGGKTWTNQNSGITDTTLDRVKFVDNSYGWAVGEPNETGGNSSATGPGTIIRTTNGGRTWQQQTTHVDSSIDPNASNDYEGLSFVGRSKGWIAVSSYNNPTPVVGQILHTSDGGAHYTSQPIPDPTSGVADVNFVDANNGWAVTDNGVILHTTDGGITPTSWAVQFTDPNGSNLEAVKFYNAMRGVAVGDGGIFVTKDGGTTWNPGAIAAPAGTFDGVTLTDVSFPTYNVVAVTTEGGNEGQPTKILYSFNGGAVFHPQSTPTSLTLNSIAFARGTNHGWASGENGGILSNDPRAGAGCSP